MNAVAAGWSKYAYLMAIDAPSRSRPLDWSSNIACLAPAQLIAYVNRHSQDPRHHWNDPAWTIGVSLDSSIDPELLRIRGGAAKLFPGMEVT